MMMMMKCCWIVALSIAWFTGGQGALGASSEKTTNNDNGITTVFKRTELGEISLTVGPTDEPLSEHDARAIANIASSLVEDHLDANEAGMPIRQLQFFRMFGVKSLSWQPLRRRSLTLTSASQQRELTGGYTKIDFRGAVAQYTVINDNVSVPDSQQLLQEMNAALFPGQPGAGLVYQLHQDPQARFSSITSADLTYTTGQPTSHPSSQPSFAPSSQPILQPSLAPSLAPSAQPSLIPTTQPSSTPSMFPSSNPSDEPIAPRSGQIAALGTSTGETTSIGGTGGANSSPVMAAAGAVVATLVLGVGFIWKRRRDKAQRSNSPTDANIDANELPSRKTKKRLHLHARDHLNIKTDTDNDDEEATDDDDASDTFSVVLAKAAAAAGTPKTVALTDNDDDTDALSSPYSPRARSPTGLSYQSAESFQNDRAMTFVLSKDMLYANTTTSPLHHTPNDKNNSNSTTIHNKNQQSILSPSHFIASDNASLTSEKTSDFVNLEFEPDAHWDPDDNDNDTIDSIHTSPSSNIFQQSSNLELIEQVTFGERIGSFIDKFRNSSNAADQQLAAQQQSTSTDDTKRTKSGDASSSIHEETSRKSRQFNNTSSTDETDSEGGHFV